jgi:ferrochelatase
VVHTSERPAATGVGLLLVNLGTPDSPRPGDVRRYLREFLSDPRVLDVPVWQRWLILNLFILPFRPKKSGEAYEKIWTERGSPLLFHGQDLVRKVQDRLGPAVAVELAMRYGRPSIEDALERMRRAAVDRIVVLPLYPQYSSAATGSTVEKVLALAGQRWNTPCLQFVPAFYGHPAFLSAFAQVARPVIEDTKPERVLFSFHGLPERQCAKSDETGAHCFKTSGCCDAIVEANRNCYRAQCFATARGVAGLLGLAADRQMVCFQSRLGRTPWIKPYTDQVVVQLAREGVKRVVVLSPAFVADCLETVEEIGMRARAQFKAGGGEELVLVPSLNATSPWIDAVAAIAERHASRKPSAGAPGG